MPKAEPFWASVIFCTIATQSSVPVRIPFYRARRRRGTATASARSPDLNAFAERWVRSVKQECLSKLILFGEAPLRRALNEYLAHYHAERPHQGKGNVLLFPELTDPASPANRVACRQRLGGLLRYYARAA